LWHKNHRFPAFCGEFAPPDGYGEWDEEKTKIFLSLLRGEGKPSWNFWINMDVTRSHFKTNF
jgi:hypothetical protein